jgi:hypothetical protein
MSAALTSQCLQDQNRRFHGTRGVSASNRGLGFLPAFFDAESGRVEVSRFGNGAPAPVHLLCGLPAEWVVARDASGTVTAVKGSVIAGFLREGCFLTREEAAALAH